MKATYWNRGESIDYVNSTSNVIEAGDIVVIDKKIGVAGTSINPNELGSLHVMGVWEVNKKASEAIDVGKPVYYSATDGITATEGTNPSAGWCIKSAKASDKTILIKIG